MWGPNRGNTLGWGCEPAPKEEPMATTEELRGAAVEAASRVNTGGVVGRVASAVDALAAAATALAAAMALVLEYKFLIFKKAELMK